MDKSDGDFFFYPADLKRKTVFIAWSGTNITIIVAAIVVSVFIFFLSFVYVPLIVTLIYAILTATFEDRSIADYVRDLLNYLLLDQLEYVWGEPEVFLRKENANAKEKDGDKADEKAK